MSPVVSEKSKSENTVREPSPQQQVSLISSRPEGHSHAEPSWKSDDVELNI